LKKTPLVSFILLNKKRRLKTVAKFFRAMGRLNIRADSALRISDPLEAVAEMCRITSTLDSSAGIIICILQRPAQ